MTVSLISGVILLCYFPVGGAIDQNLIRPWMDQFGHFTYRDNYYLVHWNHKHLKNILILVYLSFLFLWLASFKVEKLKPSRWQYGYMFWVSILCTGVVGLLKSQSQHACPWNMTQATPTGFIWDLTATHGHCFPGGHASTGFALMTGFFVYRLSSKKCAYLFLFFGLTLGFIMGWGQMMRGAHFLSHNLWTAWIIFSLNAVLYAIFYKKFQKHAQ
ncbi:phosphatase PAP2 family protein [Acinetobacter sp. 256-1]|uniref:phosphatase PAP2 family protein n=1 Tax=Acinetobacter sp. 256-1 TaxID=2746721 RepID=UPI002576E263|nr:phosphatase PAP2 family protein [Acinetobacter sp. 256-1]